MTISVLGKDGRCIMSSSHIITKSGSMIEARYRLALEEQRLILYIASIVRPTDEDFKVYTLLVEDFISLTNNNQNPYNQFELIFTSLMSKPLTIKNEDSTLTINWLSSAVYYREQGRIELCLDPKLKPHLLNQQAHLTPYQLSNVITLKSIYSIRMYELLKQYDHLSEELFTLQILRESLCIDENLYPMYSNFKQKVLNVAYKELKEKSDIFFEYKEVKHNRKTEKLRFIIHKKSWFKYRRESGTILKECLNIAQIVE